MVMTQEERWLAKYNEVVEFVTTKKRRPSKYTLEERNARNWLRHNMKLYNSGGMKPERMAQFKQLLELCERYRRKNQWE